MVMDRGTFIRTLAFLLAWGNTWLATNGLYHLPTINEEGVSIFVAFIVSCWTYYRHQYNTKKALKEKKALEILEKEKSPLL